MNIFSKRFALASAILSALALGPLSATAAVTAPDLGAAKSFAILATTFTNGAGVTTLNGDLGYTTGPASIPTFTHGTNHANDSTTASARTGQSAALADINARPCDTTTGATTIGTSPISPGVHCFTAAVTQAASTKITLSGAGVYIFKITGALTLGASAIVELTGGANAEDIFWAPVGAATLGASAIFKGTIIAPAGITLGASVNMDGRALASGGVVTTDTDTINAQTRGPVLTQVTPVPSTTSDNTPAYTFSTDEAGTISYGGSCASSTAVAVSGSNTVTFNTLTEGVHANCTVTVTDAFGNASAALAVTAFTVSSTPPLPAPAMNLLQPNGGENLTGNSVYRISWSSAGAGMTAYRVSYSTNGGVSWTFATASTTNVFYDWTVPNVSTTTARVRVEGLNSSGATIATDDSNASFTLTPGTVSIAEGADTSSSGPGAMSRASAGNRLPPDAQADALVKLPSDNNAATQFDSTIYYIGLDAKRHPFISASAYMSWYSDFSGVTVVSASTMASIPLGAPVLVRPGTRWVKIMSDPKTYYVEPGYKLRWVKDEAAAQKLGGPYWNQNVVDVDVSFFVLFSHGADIDTTLLATTWPAGMVIDSSVNILDGRGLPGLRYYVSAGKKRAFFPSSAFEANHFRSSFSWSYQADAGSMATLRAMPSGPDITASEDGLFSLLH